MGSEVGKHEDEYVCRDVDVSEQDFVESLKELESRELDDGPLCGGGE